MEDIKNWAKRYLAFGLGTVFGAVVASTTSYFVFQISMGKLDQAELLGIQSCLIERLNE